MGARSGGIWSLGGLTQLLRIQEPVPIRHLLAIAVIVAMTACAQPDYAKIENEFQKANPSCKVEFVGSGEGDADHVYVHIEYRCAGDDGSRETELLYRRQGSKWQKVSSPADAPEPEPPPLPRKKATSRGSIDERAVREQPLRIGGDVPPPVLIRRVEPDYPRGIRRVAGVIVLEGVVTRTGVVRDLKVIEGNDDPMTANVLAAVQQWKFRPAIRRGEPVDVIYVVTTQIHVK